jgi:hypothetical protein
MNTVDRKRAKLFAIGQEIQAKHTSRACGRRSCDCLAKYENTRRQYLKLIESGNESQSAPSSRRNGRS